MKRASTTLALLVGAGLFAAPMLTHAMGGGGMGGGGMPGGQGSAMPDQPQYDPQQEYQEGDAALQGGKYKDAAMHFQRVVESTPRAAEAWLKLGMSKEGAGDERGAQHAYERSVKLDDTSIAAHRALALAYLKLNQTDKAGGEIAVLHARADACHDSCSDAADLKAALDAVQAAMPAATPKPSAAIEAAHPTALASLSVATPQTGDGAYVRAVSLINERRWDDALASLDQAEAAIGPHPDILTYKGYVWRHKGDFVRAESYYQQALAMAPDHRGATEYYGELKVLKGDMAGAKLMLAKLDQVCAFGCPEAEELRLWIDRGGDPAS